MYNTIVSVANKSLPITDKDHIFLYGSRARGDANDESDWDILIVLDKERIEQQDYDNIMYPITAAGWNEGQQIIPVLYTKKEWDAYSFTPFYKSVEQDKIRIA